MARKARVILTGEAHHVTQRGNRRQNVFFCEEDYHVYLKFLQSTSGAFGFSILSYCLMPNHIHLLVVPTDPGAMREGISHLHQLYTRYINKPRGWGGHLWQGRFFSCPVESVGVPAVARYIELNPVRAKLCDVPANYRWSSAHVACEKSRNGRSGFSSIQSPATSWAEYLAMDETEEKIRGMRLAVSTGRPFGSEAFLRHVEAKAGISFALKKPGPKMERILGSD